jgi:ribosomal protein S18 acetylase RimI-like enzyme
MEHRIVPVQQLDDGQIAELAKLHQAVIHSLLSDLGLPFVEKYYQITSQDETVIGFCALSEDGLPLGWVVGSSKPEQVNARLREPLSWFIHQMMRVLLAHPKLVGQLLASARSESLELKQGCIELIYIGVAPSARGRGLAKELINIFVQASAKKYRCVSLSVEQENTEAIRLYTKVGYEIVDTVTEGKFKRHRMELKI